MSQSVCILYGLNEGPYMGRKLVATLEKAGFNVTKNPATASILIGHSGGCLLIPPKNHAQFIVQIGVPYWPGRSWFLGTIKKVQREAVTYRQERRLGEWAHKWFYYMIYAFNVSAGVRMARNLPVTKPWNNAQQQVIIRNQFDEYCSPDITQVPFNGPRTFISLPGGHDDCWMHPGPYVRLLQSLV